MTSQLDATDTETAALADLAIAAPLDAARRRSWSRSGSSTGTAVSTRRSGRSSWPGTGAACRRSTWPATTARSRRATWPRPGAGRSRPSCPPRLASAIARRLDGDRRVRIPLDLRGHSPFEQDVWRKALEIPRGEVRPYGWIAVEIGRPKAVRAVGTALGHNPVPLDRARATASSGPTARSASTRWAGPRTSGRSWPLRASTPTRWRTRARRGERLVGCASTHIVCWPTCRTGRHMLERNRRPFRSLARRARPATGRARSAAPSRRRRLSVTRRRRRYRRARRSPAYALALDHRTMPTTSARLAPTRAAIWLGLAVLYASGARPTSRSRSPSRRSRRSSWRRSASDSPALLLLGWVALRATAASSHRPTRREVRDTTIVGALLLGGGHGHGRVGRADHPVRHRRPARSR